MKFRVLPLECHSNVITSVYVKKRALFQIFPQSVTFSQVILLQLMAQTGHTGVYIQSALIILSFMDQVTNVIVTAECEQLQSSLLPWHNYNAPTWFQYHGQLL